MSVHAAAASPPSVDQCVALCVAHLKDHAQHYLNLIRSKQVEGVLWATFRMVDRASSLERPVELAKASFLALSSMVSSKADVLLRMQQDCNQRSQFVCWFTLDDGKGATVASKVLIVEALEDASLQQEANEIIARIPDFSRNHQHHNDSNARHDNLAQANSSTSRAPPLDASSQFHRSNSPKTVRDLLNRASTSERSMKTTVDPKSRPTQPIPQHPVQQPDQQQGDDNVSLPVVMRMVMQIADSVASMGAVIDQVASRCAAMEQDLATTKRRVKEIEGPLFGPEYEWSDSSNVGGTTGTESQATHASISKSGVVSSKQQPSRRNVLSNAEILVQLTELSLRISENENRVRSLEGHAQSADHSKQLVYEQVDALKKKIMELSVAGSARTSTDATTKKAIPGSGGAAADCDTDYPWRKAPDPSLVHVASKQHESDGNTYPYASSSMLLPASVKLLASPFRAYTPPVSSMNVAAQADNVQMNSNRSLSSPPRHHNPWQDALSSSPPQRTNSVPLNSSVATEGAAHRPGVLTDMLKDLEQRLGGMRPR